MSVDLLTRAAAVLRKTAETAQHSEPWCPEYMWAAIRHVQRNCDLEVDCSEHSGTAEGCGQPDMYDGRFCALMHPPVALALAAWLDAAAEVVEANYGADGFDPDAVDDTYRGAINTARAILREAP